MEASIATCEALLLQKVLIELFQKEMDVSIIFYDN